MRLRPIILDLALAIAVWTLVLWTVRQRRARMAADPSPQEVRSYRLHTVAVVSATVGVTWFFAWLISDTIGLIGCTPCRCRRPLYSSLLPPSWPDTPVATGCAANEPDGVTD